MSKAKSDLKRDSQTVTVRVNAHLKADYEQALSERGSNMSEDLRAHMCRVAENDEPDDSPLPDDDEQREAYKILDELASSRTRKVDTKTAESKLGDRLNTPKESIRSDILRPLENEGYIKPLWGRILVCEIGVSDPTKEATA